MAFSTFAGPIRVGNGDWAAGTVIAALIVPMVPTANANTDITVPTPDTHTLLRATFVTTLAYTGATVTAQLGSTVGGSQVIAAVSIKAQGVVSATIALANRDIAGQQLYLRLVQTTPTNVGTGTLYLEYVPTAQ